MLDPGEEPLPLIPGQWSPSAWSGRLVLEAWDSRRNLARRIARVKEQRKDRLALVSERFPKLEGELQIADLAAPRRREMERRTSRAAFKERFQLLLAREFPAWRLVDVSVELNLEESLSPTFARAFLRRGSQGISVMAAPPDSHDPSGVVACGLIWTEHLRRREPLTRSAIWSSMLPLGREKAVAGRAAWLNPGRIQCQLFGYDERDRVVLIDFADVGNLESSLPPCRRPESPNAGPAAFTGLPAEVDRVEQSDGSTSLRIHGLEFARSMGGKLTAGISRRSRCSMETVAAMGHEIARVRNAESEDRQHPLYSMNPEGWLESMFEPIPMPLMHRSAPLPFTDRPRFSAPEIAA